MHEKERILKTKKSPISQWLEHLQQNSWELELIISGLAIFGLIRFSEYINETGRYLTANITTNFFSDIKLIVLILGDIGTSIFIFNLIVHLFIRGLWIGAVGLRYVSGDYNYEKLNFSEKFTSFYKSSIGSFDQYIQRLENLSSVVFSFTFLLVFMLISVMMAVVFIIAFHFLLGCILEFIDREILQLISVPVSIIISFALIVVLFDFVSLGVLKRINQKQISTYYFYLYRLIGILTFSFIWRPLLLNFLDNTYTRRLLWFVVPYLIIGLLSISDLSSTPFDLYPIQNTKEINVGKSVYARAASKMSIQPFFYDKLREENKLYDHFIIKSLSLKDYRIADEVLEVFVKYEEDFESALLYENDELLTNRMSVIDRLLRFKTENGSILDSISSYGNENGAKASLIYELNVQNLLDKCKKSISYTIDNILIHKENYHCEFYQHANAGERGFLCFLPLNEIAKGRHVLEYKRLTYDSRGIDTLTYYVPFLKQ